MQKFESIIFVCLGNICRSPLAEGVAKNIAKNNNIELCVDSAGTSGYHNGEAPCTNSQIIAKKNGVDISMQKSRKVTKKDFENFDLVIALDSQNLKDLQKMGCKNCHKLGDFGANGADVPDPYFFDGLEGFDKVYEMIEECIQNLFQKVGYAKSI
jgi:protein-tyrosine phosphatase